MLEFVAAGGGLLLMAFIAIEVLRRKRVTKTIKTSLGRPDRGLGRDHETEVVWRRAYFG